MTFELRKLNASDVFPMAAIISKIGIDEFMGVLDQNKIAELSRQASDGKKSEEEASWIMGMDVTLRIGNIILTNLPKCEKEIYKFLSNISGMTVDEIKTLDIDVFLQMIMAVIQKEEFKSFFMVVSKFIS